MISVKSDAEKPAVALPAPANHTVVVGGLAASLLLLVFVSLSIGRYPIGIHDVLAILAGSLHLSPALQDSPAHLVLFNVRLPRVCAALIVGASLSGSGACYQGIFRNPMVEPSLLGVTAGSAFGAALAILLSASIVFIQLSAFIFGIIAVLTTAAIASVVNRSGEKTLTLILCGIVTGTLFASFLSLAKYVADPNSKLPAITYWLMGSLASVSMTDIQIAVISVITGLVPLMLLRWRINTLAFGDDEAKSLGVNTSLIRILAIVSSTLMTASAVSISGMIGWIGLVIPHLARMLVGPSFTILLPASVLLGALFLLFVDTVARIVFPVEIPLGILTAIMGAPFFILLLSRGKRGWV
jgi:iron complex transport system permease protein